jgi:hypothetical protein
MIIQPGGGNIRFRVIGNTGLVWGPYAADFRAQAAVHQVTTSGHMTLTFVKGGEMAHRLSAPLTGECPGTDHRKGERGRQRSRKIDPTDIRPRECVGVPSLTLWQTLSDFKTCNLL